MRKTRWLAVIFLPLLVVSFVHAQSLADLAKKEKERRAALKGKSATVITTADLAKVKKRPAVQTTNQEEVTEEAAAEAGVQEGAAQAEGGEAAAAPETAVPAAKPVETLPDLQNPAPTPKDIQAKIDELTKVANEKAELVDLLNLKMNTLYQEYYNLESAKSRETLQLQISDTYDKMLKAQLEATKAAKDLEDYVAQAQKDKAPVIWIK